MDKEKVYDERIYPLMAQISAVCSAHNISMCATFEIPTEAAPDLLCSSNLPDETGELGSTVEAMVKARDAAAKPQFAAFIITTKR